MASEESARDLAAAPGSTTAPQESTALAAESSTTAAAAQQAATFNPHVGPDPDTESDGDSAFGDGDSTASTSIASSVFDYVFENGRRYHAPRSTFGHEYDLPNDELESDRLDLQHQIFFLTLGGELHLAPIKASELHEVLDVGTGTGIWAIDFADAYPNAKITGIDLSPIQPGYVPPNCHFYVDDMEAEWAHPTQFDYIHHRMLAVAMRDWPNYFRQCFANLRPGGWVECQDLIFPLRCDDGTAGPESPPMQWSSYMIQGAAKLGVGLGAGRNIAGWMRDAGFVDVHEERLAWPINRWPRDKVEKEKGIWVLQNFLDGLQGFSLGFYTRGLGWSKDEVDVFLARVKNTLRDRRSHVYLPISVWYARKPDR